VPPTQLADHAQGLHGWVLRHRINPEDWHTGVAT
jgi:hypothetical protein